MRGLGLTVFILLFSTVLVSGYSINDNENQIFSRITNISFVINHLFPGEFGGSLNITDSTIRERTTIQFDISGEILNNHTDLVEVTYNNCASPVLLYVELENSTLQYQDSSFPSFPPDDPGFELPGDFNPPPNSTLPSYPPLPPCFDEKDFFNLEPGINDFQGNFSFILYNVKLDVIPDGKYAFKYNLRGIPIENNANTTLIVTEDGTRMIYENLPPVWDIHTQQIRLDLGLPYLLGSIILISTWITRRTIKNR